MKPLSEWAVEDLMYVIYHGTDLRDNDLDRSEFVAELLRRERERCAMVVEEHAHWDGREGNRQVCQAASHIRSLT